MPAGCKEGLFLNRNATVFSSRLKEFKDGWRGGKRGWWRKDTLLGPEGGQEGSRPFSALLQGPGFPLKH